VAGVQVRPPRRLGCHARPASHEGGRPGVYRLQPEPLEKAWEWAIRPRGATTALLSPVPDAAGDGVAVFDYLVDHE
jgi:hypothetical protein